MMTDIDAMVSMVKQGDRRALAKSITLLEDERESRQTARSQLLEGLSKEKTSSLRIGITGVPGVGKSTFIEAWGKLLLQSGCKIAILAVDPSSPLTGGSILGDRTRMPELSAHADVFIRPSPSKGTLGGVGLQTREIALACEVAGYDLILIETVGVGQSEFIVNSMVDYMLLLHLPNSGDDLQGIKKGILELADLVVITKADGHNIHAAKLAANQIEQSLQLSHNLSPVVLVSAIEKTGLPEISKFLEKAKADLSHIDKKRKQQSRTWLRE